jgi:hypothetical protein
MMNIYQHQHKGKPHTQEKFQGAAISVEGAITILVDTSEIVTSCVVLFSISLNLVAINCTLS